MTVTGECFCGKVTYKIDAPLRDARSCHCSRCRKIFSAQASAYAEVAPGAFTWLTGEELLKTFETGNGFGVRFCGNCGSPMYSDADAFEGLLFVKSGTLDDPSGLVPTMEIFCDDAQDWCKFAVQLDRVAKNPPSA